MRTAFVVLALAAGLGSGTAAAEEPKVAAPPAVFPSQISLVSVPVFVTDRNGRPVSDLTQADFEIKDDGKVVPVVAFRQVDTTSAEQQEQIRDLPAARRHFLLLFDLSFTDLLGLHRARTAARDFVRLRLAESDLAAVATVDFRRGVRLVANFTEDRQTLVHAVDTLGLPSLARVADPLALVMTPLTADIEVGPGTSSEAAALLGESLERMIALRMRVAEEQLYRRQVLTLVGSLDELGRALRVVEGRKQVLFFSAGFDSRILLGVSGQEQARANEAIAGGRLWEVDDVSRYGDSHLRKSLSRALRALAAADCVVHTVDVTGLGGSVSVEDTEVASSLTSDRPGRESLNMMAAETGGRYYKDANNLRTALGEVLAMTGRYYVVAYQPEDLRGAERFHKLKITVRRKGVRVSHRAGFHERATGAAGAVLQRQFELAQLVVTGSGADRLRFAALCLPLHMAPPDTLLSCLVQIPRGQIAESGTRVLDVFAYVVDEQGTVVDHLTRRVTLPALPADRAARGVSLQSTFRVVPGRYTVKFLVQETDGGAAGVQFVDLSVPRLPAGEGLVLPPLLLDDPALWMNLDLGHSRGGTVPALLSVGPERFVPRASFLLSGAPTERVLVLAWEPPGLHPPEGSVGIRASMTDVGGAMVPPGLFRVEKVLQDSGERRAYVLTYTPETLAAGDYTLRLGLDHARGVLESFSLLRVQRGEK